MGSYATLATRREGGVLHLTLNRPELRNAMSMAMVGELRDALREGEADGSTRIVVLRGAGCHFCAGADLKDLAAARSADASAVAETNARFGELCVAFSRTPLALVAVLEGTVMGGGFGLACVADVAIAGESAQFRLPEVAIGVVPAQIGPFLVQRLGYAQAKRLAITAARLDAHEALALGLVHQVHRDELLNAALAQVLQGILQCAPGAISATKALLAKARSAAPETLVQEAADIFARAAQGPEGLEGTSAFLQKRKPSWAPQ
jgi:isohexenylglutaconyl-CoA hydratase